MQVTERHDPIEDWLGSDVELIPPRPGTFQRVSHQARRRRTVRAVATAAGALVIIAAVATAPQIAATLLPGSNGAAKVAAGQASHGGSVPAGTSAPGSPAPNPTSAGSSRPSTGPRPRPGTGLSDTSNPAPPAFRPSSVTFVSPKVGAAIGQSGPPCPKLSCTTVAGTTNYGQTWFGASALAAGPPNGSSGVSQIRFLEAPNGTVDGWAFGPQLFATHNGGRTWTQIRGLPAGQVVVDLSTVGDRAFAVLATCTGSGTGLGYASDCTGFQVLSAAASSSSDHWAQVPGTSARRPVSPGGLQLTGQTGYLLAHGALFAGPVNGGGWHQVPNGSPSTPPCLRTPRQLSWQPGTGLLAPGSGSLYLVCTSVPGSSGPVTLGSLILYASADGGLTWQARGPVQASGTAMSLAAAPGGNLVLATESGIYYSADASTWHQANLGGPAPGRGFSYVGMTTTTEGVAVPADQGLHEIYITRDGGQIWHWQVIP